MGFGVPIGMWGSHMGFGVPIGLRRGPRWGRGVFRVPMECGGVPDGIWGPYRNVGVPEVDVGFLGSP